MSPTVSAVCLSLLAAPGYAFVGTPFVAEQVRHSPAAQTARSTTGARTSTRMVATPDKVGSGVKRNENFAKLKVDGRDSWFRYCSVIEVSYVRGGDCVEDRRRVGERFPCGLFIFVMNCCVYSSIEGSSPVKR